MAPKNQTQQTINTRLVCTHLDGIAYKKCQAEIDDQQDRKQDQQDRKQDQQAKTNKALAFIQNRGFNISYNASLVDDALEAAEKQFNEILKLRDFDLSGLAFDLIWNLGNVFVPALGTALLPLKAWRNNNIKNDALSIFKLFVGKSVERIGNLTFASASTLRDKLNQIENESNQSNPGVIETAKRQIRQQKLLGSFFTGAFYILLKENEGVLPPDYDIEKTWNEFGFGEYGKELMDISVTDLTYIMLYRLLQEYAKQKCKVTVVSRLQPEIKIKGYSALPLKGAEFQGLSQASRNAIYSIFGEKNTTNVRFSKWFGSPDFPQIQNYRDMVIHWKVPVSFSFNDIDRGYYGRR